MLNKAKEGESISPNDPVAYLIDSELAALGQPADQYKKYIEEVKEEYPQASPEYYRSTRLKVRCKIYEKL